MVWVLDKRFQVIRIVLSLQGRYLLLKIIFGGVIIVLTNESIMTYSFTLLSVSVIISSLNNYWKSLLNHVGNLSLSKFITHAMKWPISLFIKKSILSLVQSISATNIDRIKYYLDPLVEILWNIPKLTVTFGNLFTFGNLVGSHITRWKNSPEFREHYFQEISSRGPR